jgi:hypothetical protein
MKEPTTESIEAILMKKMQELNQKGEYSTAAFIDARMWWAKGYLPDLMDIMEDFNITV